jgi:chorismate mutase
VSAVRGIRGATTVQADESTLILDATEELLREVVAHNHLHIEDIASALFTVTPDLTSNFPAAAARRMGWTLVPMLNFMEIGVPDGLARCIRVLVHVNTTLTQNEMIHVYLHAARGLRPDLVRDASSAATTPTPPPSTTA